MSARAPDQLRVQLAGVQCRAADWGLWARGARAGATQAYGQVDPDGSRYLLGDHAGNLMLLVRAGAPAHGRPQRGRPRCRGGARGRARQDWPAYQRMAEPAWSCRCRGA